MRTEQVNNRNQVVVDDDNVMTRTELIKAFIDDFEGSFVGDDGFVHMNVEGKEYCVVLYNITYLGIPHPIFKKRVQIRNTVKDLFILNQAKGIKTLLFGVYSYDGRRIYCDFNIDDYIGRKLNNSSAHIFTLDLKRAGVSGIIQKTDFNENHLIVFRQDFVNEYLKFLKTGKSPETETTNVFDKFFSKIETKWDGIECYQEMMKDNFPDARQAEWPGFYLEYKFSSYLEMYPTYRLVVEYRKDKKDTGIDLDLYMHKISAYGDLKMHSSHSGGIQGNDLSTVRNLVENSRIWYIVCEHDTVKDKDSSYQVTKFWNSLLGKSNLFSYGEKMKNSVELRRYYILEINSDNFQYVGEFQQGRNSDGRPRQPKILIRSRDIGNFLIHSSIILGS